MLIESESGKELIPSIDDRQGGEERCKWVLLKGRMGEAGRGGAGMKRKSGFKAAGVCVCVVGYIYIVTIYSGKNGLE